VDLLQEHFPTSGAPDLAVACVFIPHFPLRVEILRHPELDGLPLALTDPASATARRRIIACSPEAAERGIRIGMSLRDAVNACPQAAILTADPVYYAGVFADLLRSLGSVSPGVEAGEPGCAFLDLRGLGRLHGGLENVPTVLLRCVPPTLRPRIGMAANKFTAWVAAHKARPGGSHTVPATYSKVFLARCPVELLPVPVETKRRLERFGLYTLSDVARLPPGKMQAQFGPDGRRIWDLANGCDREPFCPMQHEERIFERLPLPSATVQVEMVLMGVEQLAKRMYARPDVRGRGARQAHLQFLLEGQRSWERVVALKGTVADPESLYTTLRYRLAGLRLEGAVEEITLELSGFTAVYARQEQLFGTSLRRRQQQRVTEAVKQLKQRYGATPLYRVVPIEPWSRIPERRWGLFGYE
jgi:nucleotidyltransferase/DNA polymerase involved in DNA repair